MPETAESHSCSIQTNRNCVIELTNLTRNYCLRCPKVYMESGSTFSPPPPTVRSNHTELCSFSKIENKATGAVGVLTYELFDVRNHSCKEVMAVMFSVPFDYNFYQNWVAVGVFEHTQACDEKLYDQMYNKQQANFTRHKADGSGLKHEGNEVDLRACMSDDGQAIIKLEVYDKMD